MQSFSPVDKESPISMKSFPNLHFGRVGSAGMFLFPLMITSVSEGHRHVFGQQLSSWYDGMHPFLTLSVSDNSILQEVLTQSLFSSTGLSSKVFVQRHRRHFKSFGCMYSPSL